jgi:NodT family efflux transporter outer membrane factor (OMF) lipoprotein
MNRQTGRMRFLSRGLLCLAAFLASALALMQCGCSTSFSDWVHNGFKVGPNYHGAPAPASPQWIDSQSPRVHVGDPNLAAWWDVFDDPILTKLLHDSYSYNLTLRAAGMQILAAKEQRHIALGELLPQSQTFNAAYSRNEISGNGGVNASAAPSFGTGLAPGANIVPVTVPSTPIAGVVDPGNGATNTGTSAALNGGATPGGSGSTNRFFSNWATSFNLSWELDFWGLFRRNLEAADASLDQSVENYDEMLVLLLANVATQYIEIRTLQRRLELARQNVALQEPYVNKYRRRFDAQMANSYPGYYQLKSNLENTKALIPNLEIQLRQANNQLCTLLGIPVQDLLPQLGDGTVPDPDHPGKRYVRIPRPRDYSVVVGIPGDLLLRRPDVLAAEDQLRIQTAAIGIAEAEMYPHIGINGSIGLAADKLSRLFESQSGTGSIGPSLTWNILNYGRLLSNVHFQNFLYKQYVFEYQQAVLNANQDAENALVGYLKTLDQATFLQSSADAATNVTNYLLNQDDKGYLPPGAADTGGFINQIFTAVNFQVTQQDAAAQAQGNIGLNLVLLYRAMGGGWQLRLKDGPCPNPNPDCTAMCQVPGAVGEAPPAPATPPEQLPPPRPVDGALEPKPAAVPEKKD